VSRKPPAPGRINLGRQLISLRRRYPDGQGEINRGALTWLDWLRPSPLGRDYLIRLYHTPGAAPAVYVLTPSLSELAGGRDVPHMYSQKEGKLCLYRPKFGEWEPAMFLSETIIPWTILWLFFFEEWLFSGEWKGGGEHPRPQKNKQA